MRIQNPKKTNDNNNEKEEEEEASSSQGSLTSPAKGFLHAYSAINSSSVSETTSKRRRTKSSICSKVRSYVLTLCPSHEEYGTAQG
jgi:hypothetical protein